MLLAGLAMAAILPRTAAAQDEPWQVRRDPLTGIDCAVINADNLELVALSDTGELVIISELGEDVVDQVIAGTFVDADGFVFFGDARAGQIRFAEDSTDLTSLWWLDEFSDLVYQFDRVLEVPFLVDAFPDELIAAECDPCFAWDLDGFCDPPPPPGNSIITIICGGNTTVAMTLTLAGLAGLRTHCRRRIR